MPCKKALPINGAGAAVHHFEALVQRRAP